MADITLNENQAALVLEADEEGEITVKVIQNNQAGSEKLPASLCEVIARKLTEDEQFQSMVISGLDEL
ncbi:MAG: twitching motility protein [Desulfurivibrionaceae bacterium]